MHCKLGTCSGFHVSCSSNIPGTLFRRGESTGYGLQAIGLELLEMISPLNPMPSQMRYLGYISTRNVMPEWPPAERALTLGCVILRIVPNFHGPSGFRPIFRIVFYCVVQGVVNLQFCGVCTPS
jgi:hypothetical protein|uniref:Uncharacterized protein n=1 Tax=Zea mays TaxID=4577 RepID=A0A804R0J4_MAIZE